MLDTVQLTPTFEVGQFQPMPPPEFDLESRYRNAYQAAEAYWREEERQRMESGYDGYGGSEISDDMRKELYDIFYNALSAALNNNKLLREQKDMVEDILKKPTLDSDKLYTNFVRKSMERGGYMCGGNMLRLAVAQELYR